MYYLPPLFLLLSQNGEFIVNLLIRTSLIGFIPNIIGLYSMYSCVYDYLAVSSVVGRKKNLLTLADYDYKIVKLWDPVHIERF